MGTDLVLVGGSATLDGVEVAAVLDGAARHVALLEGVWTRFDPTSPLERLNDDPAERVAVDPRLGSAVAAALACRARTAGLVDPTLAGPVSALGYDRSISALERPAPAEVAAAAQRRPVRAARAAPRRAAVLVLADRRSVVRPPGVRIDLGGIGKGLAADRLAALLRPLDRWAASLGGDVRCGGHRHDVVQHVDVTHPVSGDVVRRLVVDRGAVATSAVTARAWRTPDGEIAHHLLDPSTGRPAWTGLLQVTAVARTALVAECRAKEALLRGPASARRVLRRDGGVLVHADGAVEDVAAEARLVAAEVAA